eukprot:TRINITY_DN61968_c0_g1_i2.p1 TRINITY_DN61968_c0_g1~~TRINITY_DN61968_c0_g1_i2.p1  ORF type:complete len:315 (+),score=57.80 TRINITY_DN61968_c0_g1_i2:53-946(+)
MLRSLVGSEMCIRDRLKQRLEVDHLKNNCEGRAVSSSLRGESLEWLQHCDLWLLFAVWPELPLELAQEEFFHLTIGCWGISAEQAAELWEKVSDECSWSAIQQLYEAHHNPESVPDVFSANYFARTLRRSFGMPWEHKCGLSMRIAWDQIAELVSGEWRVLCRPRSEHQAPFSYGLFLSVHQTENGVLEVEGGSAVPGRYVVQNSSIQHDLQTGLTQVKYSERWSNGSCDQVIGWVKCNGKMRCDVPMATHYQKARKLETMMRGDSRQVDAARFSQYFVADPGAIERCDAILNPAVT